MSDSNKAVRVIVSGRVQGVWFRGWVVENATELNLDGWVRNRHDGSVEACLFGPAENVETMLERMHSGPPLAAVKDVKVSDDADGIEPGFHQRSTV